MNSKPESAAIRIAGLVVATVLTGVTTAIIIDAAFSGTVIGSGVGQA